MLLKYSRINEIHLPVPTSLQNAVCMCIHTHLVLRKMLYENSPLIILDHCHKPQLYIPVSYAFSILVI